MSHIWAYFIYYRLTPEAAQAAPWAALFARVVEATGVQGRLYGPGLDGQTWMEVYEPILAEDRDHFEEHLQRAIRELGIENLLQAGEHRYLERFPSHGPITG